jgi:hypothetical protein
MNEEDMRLKLVYYSPLTTSVNAITWQDYIGTYMQCHAPDTYYSNTMQGILKLTNLVAINFQCCSLK